MVIEYIKFYYRNLIGNEKKFKDEQRLQRHLSLQRSQLDCDFKRRPTEPHCLVRLLYSYSQTAKSNLLAPPCLTINLNSHCHACKVLGDSAYTLNQIIPKSAFKFTKGEDMIKEYVYTGDSGKAKSTEQQRRMDRKNILSTTLTYSVKQANQSTVTTAATAPLLHTTIKKSADRTRMFCAPLSCQRQRAGSLLRLSMARTSTAGSRRLQRRLICCRLNIRC